MKGHCDVVSRAIPQEDGATNAASRKISCDGCCGGVIGSHISSNLRANPIMLERI